jgi:predicted nucleotidyltransferase component of viral defense system
MNDAVRSMLAKYTCKSIEDQERALREIIQEIALLGLWRAKFFEHAAFYGGTALRILHDLDRFSEDLDFTLLRSDQLFSLQKYAQAITTELASFDIDAVFERKSKDFDTPIESAFIKANTMIHMVKFGSQWRTYKDKVSRIKIEVDTDPPLDFTTEARQHFQPIQFTVKTLSLPDLFAGKLHALLFRPRTRNLKGRDWYDLLWYVGRSVPVRLEHLECRARQSGNWSAPQKLDLAALRLLLDSKLASVDIDELKNDVRPFINDQGRLNAWSVELFEAAFAKINAAISRQGPKL